METKLLLWSASVIFAFALDPSSLNAQGSLTPPGAPAATMKSLDQIEARTPISSAQFAIFQPGSYYLTTNLTVAAGSAIYVATNQVTLDLNGFTISSTDNAETGGSGILLNASNADITILNGHITSGVTDNGGTFSGLGFANGISIYGPGLFSNIRVTGVSVSGCLNNGIYVVSPSSIVDSCTVQNVGGIGIVAQVITHCAASSCGNTAIYGTTVSDCSGQCVGSSGDGIIANNTANNCTGVSAGGFGVFANTCASCYGQSNSGVGTHVNSNASNSYGTSQTADGMDVDGAAVNCVGQSAGAGEGFYAYLAIGCEGFSNSGFGLDATLGNSSYGFSETGTDESVANKYNMP
jgi:hypothetical protein